jgi:serine/threonine-protein kinase
MVGDPGRYRVFELVSSDGLVTTLRAEDRELGRIVLLRLFDVSDKKPDHPDRMVDIARNVMRVVHPNAQSVFDAGRNGLRVYISQERVDGETYAALIRRSGPLVPKDLGAVLLQVAEGLAYAHGQGVIHQGLRPEVLMTHPNGSLKITDFCLSRLVAVAADKPGLVSHDLAIPLALDACYMAPEQVTGHAADARTDIYNLGLVLFFMATGRSPFEIRKVTDQIEVARMQVSSGFPMPSTIRATLPEQVDDLFVRCTMKNPAERYGSAGELLEAIKQHLCRS